MKTEQDIYLKTLLDIRKQQVKVKKLSEQLFGQDDLCYRSILNDIKETQQKIDSLTIKKIK